MGSGIAEVCARAGLDVVVTELDEAGLALGQRRIETSLARAVKAGKITGVMREQILGRIRCTTDENDLYDRDLVIEAVSENEALKVEVFQWIDKVVDSEHAVLASTTSSIPIMKLAM